MKKVLAIISLFPVLPTIALAQTLSAQGFIKGFLAFSNKTLIPALLGIAFLLFVINVIRFFVIQGSEEDGRENAKNLALYSVLTFVVLIVFWGVINLLAGSLGFSGKSAPTPDYLEKNEEALKRTPVRNPAVNSGSPSQGNPNPPVAPDTNDQPGEPINLLPPQYGGPAENVNCPPGSSFNTGSNSCDYQ